MLTFARGFSRVIAGSWNSGDGLNQYLMKLYQIHRRYKSKHVTHSWHPALHFFPFFLPTRKWVRAYRNALGPSSCPKIPTGIYLYEYQGRNYLRKGYGLYPSLNKDIRSDTNNTVLYNTARTFVQYVLCGVVLYR